MSSNMFYPPPPGTMTRDEHIAEAENCLYRAMSRGAGTVDHAQKATAEATVGLLHVALAAQKPFVVVPSGSMGKEATDV